MHEDFLKETLRLATARQGLTGSNPAVGAVLVKDGAVLAEGSHLGSGHPHAEIEALRALKGSARGTTMYVSLEPCCFEGKTPACTASLIREGISRVVYAYEDPNPKVSGRGADALRRAGIEVHRAFLPEIDDFYESYAYWVKHGRPFVIAKLALSLDGKTAAADGSPVRLTRETSQRFTHEGRKRAHAILTTSKTVTADDPQLNVRLGEKKISKSVYILDARLETPGRSRIFQTSQVTLFHGPRPPAETAFGSEVNLRELPLDEKGRFNLEDILAEIGKAGHHELWVEAGGALFKSFIEAQKIQRAFIYVAPACLGAGGRDAFREPLQILTSHARVTWSSLGADGLCRIEWT